MLSPCWLFDGQLTRACVDSVSRAATPVCAVCRVVKRAMPETLLCSGPLDHLGMTTTVTSAMYAVMWAARATDLLRTSGRWGPRPKGVSQGFEKQYSQGRSPGKDSKAPAATRISSRAPLKQRAEVRKFVTPGTRHHWRCWLEDAQLWARGAGAGQAAGPRSDRPCL